MQSSVDTKKISKKQLINIQEELKLDQRQLETALKKIPQWLHAVGVNKNLEKIMVEVIRLTRRYSPYNEVSPRLEKLLKQEFEATKDFVSVESIRAENHLPKNKMTKFMLENKKDSIADFLGVNIFLDSNQSYIRKRKIKAFVNRFFVWLLSNNAAMIGIVVNEEYGILDKFYCLEEIKVGNSKKGRILGFYKNDEGVNCAIVGFYNGQIKFLKAVRRSQEGLVAPKFKQYDYKTPPVTFNFTLETVLDKNNRTLFNLLLRGKENAATKVIWGGGAPGTLYNRYFSYSS